MTSGIAHPQVAIEEAMHAAGTQGYTVLPLAVDDLPFDFIIQSRQSIAFVRMRRLRYATYDPEEIRESCAAEIAELRGTTGSPMFFAVTVPVRVPEKILIPTPAASGCHCHKA